MSTPWRTRPQVSSTDVVDADLLPFSDESLAAGSRSTIISVASLRRVLGVVEVNTYSANRTISAAEDAGAHLRFTAAADLIIPAGLPIGTSWVGSNATVSDTVTIDASAVTLLSDGVEIDNGRWVAFLVVSTDVVEAVGAFADAVEALELNAQTGTTYTLALTDSGSDRLLTLDNASAITLTVPLNSSVAFAVGAQIDSAQLGAGLVSVAGAAGVTINGVDPGSEASAGQWSRWRLVQLATDVWLASGDLA